jgi:hypothetical protein
MTVKTTKASRKPTIVRTVIKISVPQKGHFVKGK